VWATVVAVSAVMKDRSGSVWVGVAMAGVVRRSVRVRMGRRWCGCMGDRFSVVS